MTRMLLIFVTLAAACASTRPVRFVNAPPVTAVDDRRDTPKAPRPREFARTQYHVHGNFVRRLTRVLEVQRHQRARGVNALDEVPDSTWFTNRIGVRDLSVDEIRRGPEVVGSPEAHLPWTVKSTKVGGRTLGFIITDARGERFVLKFDQKGLPEMETAADAITSRLLWAAGYNVPEDHVVYVRPAELTLAPDARIKDVFGNTRALGERELANLLAGVEREPDGRVRGLASRILDGTWLGGHPSEGVRADDPNDVIPHELRRDLRGAYAIFAWLDHVDVKEDNFLDMWVADPDEGTHYVKHYLVDFGTALGVMAAKSGDLRRGYTYFFDPADMLGSLLTLGTHSRRWTERQRTRLHGVGVFDLTGYDPGRWKPYNATYVPFRAADRFDNLWGAKIAIRFTREQLRAAVEAGRFSDPRATEYVTDMLVARQRETARYWFRRTAPLDRFELVEGPRGHSLCFADLSLVYRLERVERVTRYDVSTSDREGRVLDRFAPLGPAAGGRSCTPPLQLAAGGDGYTIIALRTRRTSFDRMTFIHVARSGGAPRIVGVWRQ